MDGCEYADDLGKSITNEEFYQRVKNGAMPVTSQVNAEQYETMFEPFLKDGKDIIHITLSSGISGTINSAQIARDEMAERYPDRRITVVDSLSASSGYGLLVDTAWEKMQSGLRLRRALRLASFVPGQPAPLVFHLGPLPLKARGTHFRFRGVLRRDVKHLPPDGGQPGG
mgnify:CR=1 FL=1